MRNEFRPLPFCLYALAAVVAATLYGCRGESPLQYCQEYPPAFAQNQQLGRGINLGNALEAPNEGDWGVILQDWFFPTVKQAGFQSVRIPVRWSAHAALASPYEIDPEFLARIQWAVDQAIANGLAAVIDFHHYYELMLQPGGMHRDRFLAIWQKVADHFQSYPNTLYFDLLNEPHDAMTAAAWNELAAAAIREVRRSNPGRTLIISAAQRGAVAALDSLQLPADDCNLIVSIHYFEPLRFTHQGAEWLPGSESWLGTAWRNSYAERMAIVSDFDLAARWSDRTQRPIFVGEFGTYRRAGMRSRARWTAFVVETAKARRFSFAYWEFCAGFGAYDKDKQQWHQSLLTALLQ